MDVTVDLTVIFELVLGLSHAVIELNASRFVRVNIKKISATFAPSEDRTHDLEIMRLTRYLLRHRGGCTSKIGCKI